jgi:acetyl esterase/lipase
MRQESRGFNVVSGATTGDQPQPDLITPEGLQEARDILTSSLAQPGPPAVECLAEAGGRLFAKEFFIEAYVGNVADRTNPDISPLYGDLSGLPPALLVVGTLDILLEDNLATAARLSSAGGEVDVRVYPEYPTASPPSRFPTAMAAAARGIESWLADRLAGK